MQLYVDVCEGETPFVYLHVNLEIVKVAVTLPISDLGAMVKHFREGCVEPLYLERPMEGISPVMLRREETEGRWLLYDGATFVRLEDKVASRAIRLLERVIPGNAGRIEEEVLPVPKAPKTRRRQHQC